MAISRAERTGLGVALAAHLALFALLSVSWSTGPDPRFDNPPMTVDLIAEVAPVSTSPEPASEMPAARQGELVPEESPPAPRPLPPTPRPTPPPPVPKKVDATPPPRPTPRVERPRPEPPRRTEERSNRPQPQAQQRQAQRTPTRDTRASGDPLSDIADSVARSAPRGSTGTAAPAAQSAAEVRQAITVAVDREIAPFWQRNVPSGIDIEQLRVTLEIRLNRDGSISAIRQVGELTGTTESNRPQQALFVERAIRSIRQAAPFNLPVEHYDEWQVVRQPFAARRRG